MVRSKFFLLLSVFLFPQLLKAQDPIVIEHSLELFKKEYPEGFELLNTSALRYAGDINGDGIADFRLGFNSVDLDTEDLYDERYEYKIYFGSSDPITDYSAEYIFDNLNLFALPGFDPIGDLNGDGCDDHKILSNRFFFDFSCGDFTDTMSVNLDINFSIRYSTIETDLNNDGFEDIILHQRDLGGDAPFKFGIIYGAENPDSMKHKEFEISFKLNEEDMQDRYYREASFTAGDIDNDGETEIIVFGYNRASESDFTEYNPGDILILEESDSVGYEVVFSYNLPFEELRESSRIYLGDYKQGGLKEILILESFETKVLLELEKTETGFEVTEEVNLIDEGFNLSFIYPIGDYDQDGVYDFFSFGLGTYNTKVLFGTSELGVFESREVTVTDRFLNAGNQSYYSSTPEGFLGDVNNDGFPDFILNSTKLIEGEESPGIDNYYGTGLIFEYGDSSRDITKNHELYYEVPAHQEPVATFNAGDFNGDGIEDYGVLFENSLTSEKKSRIELFFGGAGKTNWGTPDLIFQTEDGYQPSFPAIGDFNGDGVDDLAINFQHQSSGIHFYWGGSVPDNVSDHSIKVLDVVNFSNFEGQFNGFSILENVDDINGDGVDDLAFTGPEYNQNGNTIFDSFIVYGGELSSTFDIKFEEIFNNLQRLGDIDSDGKNEFLASRAGNYAYIYEEFDQSAGESFSTTPEYEIIQYFPNLDNNYNTPVFGFGFSSSLGDFNGDGNNDVAISGLAHRIGERVNYYPYYGYNGGSLIFIFYGGSNFDVQSDQEISIPIENLRIKGLEQFDLIDTEYVYVSRGEITSIPGFTSDALLIGTNSRDFLTNALIYENDGDSLLPTTLIKGKNQSVGLGSLNYDGANNVPLLNPKSAIGDFNNDGELDFLLPQAGDPNFPEDPVLLFSLGIIQTSSKVEEDQPLIFSLSLNYPNPFNPATQITYSLAKTEKVSLKVYDITGRLVSTLVDEVKAAGTYSLNFNASGLSSGVYFYRLSSSEGIQTRKMTLIK